MPDPSGHVRVMVSDNMDQRPVNNRDIVDGLPKIARLLTITVEAKDDDLVVTSKYGDAVSNVLAVAASPTTPRNLIATFGATWDVANNLTVVGTDQFDNPQTETITANPGGTATTATIWKTVTSVTKSFVGVGSHATNTVKLGTGDTIGLPGPVRASDTLGFGYVGTTIEAVTINTTYHSFVPTTTPSATTFVLLINTFGPTGDVTSRT